MKPLKIGVVLESLGLPLRAGLNVAARAGAAGVELDAGGDVSPNTLGETGRREFRNLLRSFDLELAALNVPLRRGLDTPDDLQPRIDWIRKVMQLSFDLGARRVVVPLPRLPDDSPSPREQFLRESLTALGSHGDRIGCFVALEVGYDAAEKVEAFLTTFGSGSLKVTYDPANFMLHGHDPLKNLHPLGALVAHVHARDARETGVSRGAQEVPVGAGDVDWMALTVALQVLDFDGFLSVKREQGENKQTDVTNGVAFLKRFALPTM